MGGEITDWRSMGDKPSEIERVRRQEERRPRKGRRGVVDAERLREKEEIQRVIRALARDRDEEAFRQLLSERLGIDLESEQAARCLREFWNLAREFERQRGGSL